jgi:hypothetical protein
LARREKSFFFLKNWREIMPHVWLTHFFLLLASQQRKNPCQAVSSWSAIWCTERFSYLTLNSKTWLHVQCYAVNEMESWVLASIFCGGFNAIWFELCKKKSREIKIRLRPCETN